MMEELLEQTTTLVFHGTAHEITASVLDGPTLKVQVEAEDGNARWRGEFPAKYVEGITQKTGSAKKFPVFVKMLFTALGDGSDSVFVDLLTYADLESLKTRRASSGISSNQQQQQQQQQHAFSSRGGVGRDGDGNIGNSNINKRYLILTYAGEYDRVHYPLPLAFVENDHGREGLSEEDEEDREEPRSMSRTKEENAELRRQVELLTSRLKAAEERMARRVGEEEEEGTEGEGREGGNLRRLRRVNEDLQAQLDDLQEAYSSLRANSAAEIRRLSREARDAAKFADEHSTKADEAMDQVIALREEVERSESRVRKSEAVRRKEVDKLKKELAKERVTCRAMRAKIRELSALKGAPDPRAYYGKGNGTVSTRRGGGTGIGRSASRSASRSGRRSSGGSAASANGRISNTKNDSATRGRTTTPWGLSTTTPRGDESRGSTRLSRGRSGSRRRADSPRHPPPPRASSRSSVGATGRGRALGSAATRLGRSASRGSSRGSSPASSRGRSRSVGSAGRRGRGVPAFDPTQYQREKEERLRRQDEERRRRERNEIGYSSGRGSGRDSWMVSSSERGPGSSFFDGGISRGRSAVRTGSSGYLSAGSQGSRTSRGSRGSRGSSSGRSARSDASRAPSRLSRLSAGSSPSSTRTPRTTNRRTTSGGTGSTTALGKTKRSPSPHLRSRRGREDGGGDNSTRTRYSPGGHKNIDVNINGFSTRRNISDSRMRPKTTSSSPRNFFGGTSSRAPAADYGAGVGDRGRVDDEGVGAGGLGRGGFVRLVRDPSGTTSSTRAPISTANAASHPTSDTAPRNAYGASAARDSPLEDPLSRGRGAWNSLEPETFHGGGDGSGGRRIVRLLSATASAVVGDRPHGKSSYRHSLDCGNGVGAADDGNFDQFGLPPPPSVPRRGANGASSRYGGVDDEAAALVRVNSDARARVSGAAGGLASSVGSFGSSSLGSRRSTAAGIGGDGGAEGGRKRVELRTPAEEEAVRRSNDLLLSSLGSGRPVKTNVGTASPSPREYYLRRQQQQQGPNKQQRPEQGSRSNDDGAKLEAGAALSLTLPPPLPRYPGTAVARYSSQGRDDADNDGAEQSVGQRENNADSSSGSSSNNDNNISNDNLDDVAMINKAGQGGGGGGGGDDGGDGGEAPGAGAGREMSDIDRRLGELHDFLRRAKAGSTGSGGGDESTRAASESSTVRPEPALDRLRSLARVDGSVPAEERPLTPLAYEQDGTGEGGAGGEEHEEDGRASLVSQQDSLVSSQGGEVR